MSLFLYTFSIIIFLRNVDQHSINLFFIVPFSFYTTPDDNFLLEFSFAASS